MPPKTPDQLQKIKENLAILKRKGKELNFREIMENSTAQLLRLAQVPPKVVEMWPMVTDGFPPEEYRNHLMKLFNCDIIKLEQYIKENDLKIMNEIS